MSEGQRGQDRGGRIDIHHNNPICPLINAECRMMNAEW
jgi:hypothetical protein